MTKSFQATLRKALFHLFRNSKCLIWVTISCKHLTFSLNCQLSLNFTCNTISWEPLATHVTCSHCGLLIFPTTIGLVTVIWSFLLDSCVILVIKYKLLVELLRSVFITWFQIYYIYKYCTGRSINELENGPSSYKQKCIYFEWVFMKL